MFLFKRANNSKIFVNTLKKKASGEIYSKEEFKSIIEKERARADRNNHKLSLVIFDMGSSDPKNTDTIQLIEKVWNRIRCTDEVGWYKNQRIGIILSNTSNEGATKLAENICESLYESIPKSVCAVYTYPLDKLNNK
jgi:GGDEF domain-containing protein